MIGRHGLYEHLDRLLDELEALLEQGWSTHQLRTSSRDEFGSLVAEALVAHEFDARGFKLVPTVGETLEGAKPEFYADDGSLRVGVEVFQPRDWRLLDEFNRKAISLLADADVSLDFRASLVLRLEHLFDEQHRLIHAYPELLERGIAIAGMAMLGKLVAEFARLKAPSHTLIVAYPDVNLEFEAAFEGVAASGDRPDRCVSHGYSTGAYDPEAAFIDILHRVRAKAGERQAGPPASPHIRLLVVDISTNPFVAHLDDDVRRPHYLDALRDFLLPTITEDYDVIGLCVPSWDRGLGPAFVCAVSAEVAEAALGALPGDVITAS